LSWRHSPTLIPSCLGDEQDVVNFAQRFKSNSNIKGIPPFDPKRVVHASQTIEVLKPLPLVSGPGWKLKKRLAAIRENSAFRPFPFIYSKH
jgi:peroxisomal enoyl-CoA hydratase 2